MNTQIRSNRDPEIVELDALAQTKGGRFYFNRRDGQYRFVRGNQRTELHTFSMTPQARQWLLTLPVQATYSGSSETLPGAVRPERPRGVEIPRVLERVTPRFLSRY